MADSGPRTRRILTALFALAALIVAFLMVISEWQGIFGAASSLLAALGSRWGGFIIIGLFMLLAMWASGHLERIWWRLIGRQEPSEAPQPQKAIAATPPDAPLSRHRMLKIGQRVMNHDGTECRYHVSDPDYHPHFHRLHNDEERVDGVTARLNAYHDEALTLSAASRTTTQEWAEFWQGFNAFVLRHMAISRQSESIALADASTRTKGQYVAEWSRERCAAAAALIAGWLDGRGLTRFDLAKAESQV